MRRAILTLALAAGLTVLVMIGAPGAQTETLAVKPSSSPTGTPTASPTPTPPPIADPTFTFNVVRNDIVAYGDCDELTCDQLWSKRDGIKDAIFVLEVPANQYVTLTKIQIDSTTEHWDTIPDNVVWAIGVTNPKSRTLLNLADSTYTSDLSNGLKLWLHVDNSNQGADFFTAGREFTLTLTYTEKAYTRTWYSIVSTTIPI